MSVKKLFYCDIPNGTLNTGLRYIYNYLNSLEKIALM